MNNKYPMTVEGAEALKKELEHLKFVKRPSIVEAVATARAHGDLKENAEYQEARREHGLNEGRILELEAKLSHAQIIDITTIPNQGKIIFGSTVQVCQLDTDTEMTFKIVGEEEADIKLNKISYSSPIGRALISKMVDDVVVVETPGGIVEYEILAVDYI